MKKQIEIKVEFLNDDDPAIIKEKFDGEEIHNIDDAKKLQKKF